jgi:ATP-dependent Clp protease ATP-binding subunit ClpA
MSVSSVKSPVFLNMPQHEISRVLLIIGFGILSYEITAKAVQKFANENFKDLKRATFSAVLLAVGMILQASVFDLPRLQASFTALCMVYVLISLVKKRVFTSAAQLPSHMTDMVELARKGKYIQHIGYEDKLKEAEIIMNSPDKKNAALVGYMGIGKSAIPETIACKIANNLYPRHSIFYESKLIQVDLNSMLADTKWRGTLEARVKEMIDLAKKDPKIIYWIDEIHLLAGAGRTHETHSDISNLLLPAMARDEIRILGASTPEDYDKYIKRGLSRRLPRVNIDPPLPKKCYEMLRHKYDITCRESRYKVSNRAIAAAVFFSGRDIHEFYLPDKAIFEIEYALSKMRDENPEPQADLTIGVLQIAEAHLTRLPSHPTRTASVLMGQFEAYVRANPHFPELALEILD